MRKVTNRTANHGLRFTTPAGRALTTSTLNYRTFLIALNASLNSCIPFKDSVIVYALVGNKYALVNRLDVSLK